MTRSGSRFNLDWRDLFKVAVTVLTIMLPPYVRMEVANANQNRSLEHLNEKLDIEVKNAKASQDDRIESLEREINMLRDDIKDLRTFLMNNKNETTP